MQKNIILLASTTIVQPAQIWLLPVTFKNAFWEGLLNLARLIPRSKLVYRGAQGETQAKINLNLSTLRSVWKQAQ